MVIQRGGEELDMTEQLSVYAHKLGAYFKGNS